MSMFRVLTLSAFAAICLPATGAMAQSAACAEGGNLMQARGTLIQSVSAQGKKKMTPDQACSRFGALVANGNKLIGWLDQNAAWCNVPENVVARVKEDHAQSIKIRGQACGVAAKVRQMQAQQARAQRQQAPGGFGGNGGDVVSGALRVPSGAL